MAEQFAELAFALDLLLLAAACWALAARRWWLAAGAAISFAGSMPMLFLALAGQFRAAGALVFLASVAAGLVIGSRGLDLGGRA